MQKLKKNYSLIKDLLKKIKICKQFIIKANTLKTPGIFSQQLIIF
ncbi:hypothetical protein CHRY9390_02742 [Chryseobacterium aquaeductus]|uniref:Uncharacterized protein n=1 Tax=Chryseobacterium aquaeductus TaxID=2675056 RepID=A0A9N8QRG7_9FLAO|nr:hypothetical protein CHRY9390_02742 [Chryseobacterium potabilaquae]CAD7814007.1 hypothetical protein CHRY9390_02742 [Chryseobacterium aquaeductus]